MNKHNAFREYLQGRYNLYKYIISDSLSPYMCEVIMKEIDGLRKTFEKTFKNELG